MHRRSLYTMDLEVVGRMLSSKEGRTAYENMLEVVSYAVSFASFYIFVCVARVGRHSRPQC